jgi:hypothetical protein
MKRTLLVIAFCVTAGPALAQHQGHHGHGAHSQGAQHAQPYAGQDVRAITSLSDEDIAGYRAGRGMGLAKPAELNGFPGPMHVLELAEDLQLSEAQRNDVQSSFDRMIVRAQKAGDAYIAAERALDNLFRSSAMPSAEDLKRHVEAAELAQAEVRRAHLDAHLEVAPLLTADQRRRYAELRGYATKP